MFFRKRQVPKSPPQPIVEVFVRHATYSSASAHKKRPPHFSREACHRNLLATAKDRAHGGDHFLKGKAIEIQEGSEARSFLRQLNFVKDLPLHPDTIVYFLEDDYLHRPGWVDVLFEGFSLGADYVTLYDHRDKYTMYPKLRSQIFATPSCHWRTTPSTTNTYAMRFSTLLEDFLIHRRFSLARNITADHDKFCFLGKKGRVLISSMPGFSTHADPEFVSPCIDWEPYYFP
jgi:glycosyltransferase involved in cell wall biosynthesis